jgi:predicted nucleic acid-binding protein
MTVLVDSDILIDVSRARNATLLAQWMELSESDALILFSPVTAAELWAGARPAEYSKLEALFGALVCAPADGPIGRRAGEFLRRYRKSHSVELGDALIAASAMASGARLWTRNRKPYPMPGLTFYE